MAFLAQQAVEYIYNYILQIDDEEVLDTIWIRSTRPYLIEISLRMIQQTIRASGTVHFDCFNLAVRRLTCAEGERHVGTRFLGWRYTFDLQLQALAQSLDRSWMHREERTMTLIDNFIFVIPLVVMDVYTLLVVNMESKRSFFMDPSYHVDMKESLYHNMETEKARSNMLMEFNEVLRVIKPDWNDQVAYWPMDSNLVMPMERNSGGSGFIVPNFMASCDGESRCVFPVTHDPTEVRKQFVVQLLMCKGNSALDNIPEAVKSEFEGHKGMKGLSLIERVIT